MAAVGAAAGAAGAGYAAGQTAEAVSDVASQGIDEINQILTAMDSTVMTFDATDWIEAIRRWYHGDDYTPLFTRPVTVKLSALRIILMIMVVCLFQSLGRFNRENGRLPTPAELLTAEGFGIKEWVTMFPVLQELQTSVTRGSNYFRDIQREPGWQPGEIAARVLAPDWETSRKEKAAILKALGI